MEYGAACGCRSACVDILMYLFCHDIEQEHAVDTVRRAASVGRASDTEETQGDHSSGTNQISAQLQTV